MVFRQRRQDASLCLFPSQQLTLKDVAENVLAATQPAYKKVGNALITAATQLSTNSQDPHEGPIAGLIDNNEDTYFHSSYRAGRPNNPYIAVTFDNASVTRLSK